MPKNFNSNEHNSNNTSSKIITSRNTSIPHPLPHSTDNQNLDSPTKERDRFFLMQGLYKTQIGIKISRSVQQRLDLITGLKKSCCIFFN